MKGGTPFILVITGFLVIAFFSGVLLSTIQAQKTLIAIYNDKYRSLSDTNEILQTVLTLLNTDATPMADTPDDPVWSYVNQLPGVTMTDVSSKINPNLVRQTILDDSILSAFLLPGVSGNQIQQYREDQGLFLDIKAGYEQFFEEEVFEQLTPYGPANVNTADEFALRKLYELITNDEAASQRFWFQIRESLQNQERFTQEDLVPLLSPHYDKLSQVFHMGPTINVNFASEFVLHSILSYEPFEFSRPAQTAARLRNSLSSFANSAEVAAELGLTPEHKILDFIGTMTWVFKLTIERKGVSSTILLQRAWSGIDGLVASEDVAQTQKKALHWSVVQNTYLLSDLLQVEDE